MLLVSVLVSNNLASSDSYYFTQLMVIGDHRWSIRKLPNNLSPQLDRGINHIISPLLYGGETLAHLGLSVLLFFSCTQPYPLYFWLLVQVFIRCPFACSLWIFAPSVILRKRSGSTITSNSLRSSHSKKLCNELCIVKLAPAEPINVM